MNRAEAFGLYPPNSREPDRTLEQGSSVIGTALKFPSDEGIRVKGLGNKCTAGGGGGAWGQGWAVLVQMENVNPKDRIKRLLGSGLSAINA